jgi:hypothetical protein
MFTSETVYSSEMVVWKYRWFDAFRTVFNLDLNLFDPNASSMIGTVVFG